MRSIILAAGRGSRMKGMTEELPKALIAVHGKKLLEHQIQAMRESGISEIAVVGGYKNEMLPKSPFSEFFINEQWQVTNMVRSLQCASSWLSKDDCIVSYSDIFYNYQAPSLFLKNTDQIAITYDVNFLDLWSSRFSDPLSDLETFVVDDFGYLASIGARATHLDQIQGQYMGLLKFSAQGWQLSSDILNALSADVVNKLDMTSFLQLLIENGFKIKAIPFKGVWGEIDHISDYEYYHSDSFLSRA